VKPLSLSDNVLCTNIDETRVAACNVKHSICRTICINCIKRVLTRCEVVYYNCDTSSAASVDRSAYALTIVYQIHLYTNFTYSKTCSYICW